MTSKSGIYKIINHKNNKFYIGSSTNIYFRWYNHKSNALSGSTKSPHLYSAIRKYGIENFEIKPILICDKENLQFYEQLFLNLYVGLDECYNISRDAVAPMRNASPETIKKLSLSISKSTKGRIPWNKGIPRTAEDKEKIRARTKEAMSKLDNSISDGTKKILSQKLKGRKFSIETRKKMSLAKKGIVPWNLGIKHDAQAKLTENQVLSIRSKYIYGKYGYKKLSLEFNVNPSTIDAIIKRRTWSYL